MNSVLRLNMTLPGLDPELLSAMYAASLDMAAFADASGFTAVTTDEHHGADDGWMPATLVYTGMLAGAHDAGSRSRCRRCCSRCTIRSAWRKTSPCSISRAADGSR